MKFNEKKIIDAYNTGLSMNTIAKNLHTYPTTIKRILEKHEIELRHDERAKGSLCVQGGDELIEWAKSKGRLVTKAELAEHLGKVRLSPSYFLKYPELGQYVTTREQEGSREYSQKLYKWLRENDISYKPKDRTKLGVSVDALLLGNYTGFAFQINERPKCVSKKKFNDYLQAKVRSSLEHGVLILFLTKENLDNLDKVKVVLDELAKR